MCILLVLGVSVRAFCPCWQPFLARQLFTHSLAVVVLFTVINIVYIVIQLYLQHAQHLFYIFIKMDMRWG